MKWLVRGDAREGVDYDPQQLRWLWDETTRQDKDIIELNARGVASRGYVPGPYSTLEGVTADFIARYLKLMASA
jgi:Rieske 2Fe-2S family protein